MLIFPWCVKSVPFLAFLVGITQSNMSKPLSTATSTSARSPTPIRYLGLSKGICGDMQEIISYISSLLSPTLKPPTAYPSNPIASNSSRLLFLRSLYIPPWMMPLALLQGTFCIIGPNLLSTQEIGQHTHILPGKVCIHQRPLQCRSLTASEFASLSPDQGSEGS